MNKRYFRALTVAGSDSGGGAGIQADLKTFSALGCYGMSVITALTAQNTCAVTAILEIPAGMVADQLEAVLSDIGTDAVKIGMLQSPEVIETVAEVLNRYRVEHLVLDPVMVAKSGDKLLRDDAVGVLKKKLLPMAEVITPNLPEAEVLLGYPVRDREDMIRAGRDLLNLGPRAVLVKGGHSQGEKSDDLLLRASKGAGCSEIWLESPRLNTGNTHGTGCTLSSAITAGLARGLSVETAVLEAKDYISGAISAGAEYSLGKGHGPVHHFFRFY